MSAEPGIVLPTRLAETTQSAARRSGSGLPAALEAKARRRLGQFGAMMAVLATIVLLVSRPVWQDHPEPGQLLVVLVMQILTIALSAALYLVARSGRLADATVLDLGLVYEVLFCFTVSLGYNWFTGSTYGVFAAITIATVVIAVYPMIVPSPPRKTLVAAVAAAAMAPLGILIVSVAGVATAGYPDYLGVSIYPSVCVVLAVFGSRVIYGLSRDVARAQDLGSYHLEELLGRGGMGEVWRARHRLLARPAAVKLIRHDAPFGAAPADGQRVLQRFEREAQVTAALTSPHTVALFDFGTTEQGEFYYVMELLDGLDLEHLVKDHGTVPPERAVAILTQVCKSLAEAHDASLVHRDIKPANILVCRYGREYDFVKVLDFGQVALAPEPRTEDAKLTVGGYAGGTPAYVPPEMCVGVPVDGRADIYSLGCVAFWLLTGRLVFERPSPMAVILAHMKEDPQPPSRFASTEIPEALDRIVMACLHKDPDRRPRSADELMERLEACPLAAPWTQRRARQWWQEHVPTSAHCPSPS